MPKTVAKLKAKHRNRIWRDEEGDFWYWDSELEHWTVLLADIDHYGKPEGFYISTQFPPECYSHFTCIGKANI